MFTITPADMSPSMSFPPTSVGSHNKQTVARNPPSSASSNPTSPTATPPSTFIDPLWSFLSELQGSSAYNTTRQGCKQPSLAHPNQRSGDAPASPFIVRGARNDISIGSAAEWIQGVTHPDEVDDRVRDIVKWLQGLPEKDKETATNAIRLAVLRLFSDVWNPPSRTNLLSFKKYDVFINRRLLSLDWMEECDLQRLRNTAYAHVLALLIGRLLHVNILSSHDVVVLADMLYAHRYEDGYMQGLHVLLSAAGDKVCGLISRVPMDILLRCLKHMKALAARLRSLPTLPRPLPLSFALAVDHFNEYEAFSCLSHSLSITW